MQCKPSGINIDINKGLRYMTNIKKMRLKRKITQKEFATLAGRHRVSISKLERLGIRRIDTARYYASLLKCSPLDLMDI